MKFFKHELNIQDYSEYPPTFHYLKHLHLTDPSFVTITKPLSNMTGETFCEELKRMCKLFEIDDQNYF